MSKCKSCGKDIVWIKMESGKSMPCDPFAISFDLAHPGDKNALVLVEKNGKVARGYFNPCGDHIGYTSHFSTCPNADAHRKNSKK